jgi:hypothetical protein
MMCLKAAPLIAACVGYLPSPGSAVTVSESCISTFRIRIQSAAKACASEHKIRWTIDGR